MGDIQSLQVVVKCNCSKNTVYHGKLSVKTGRKATGLSQLKPAGLPR